MALETAFLIGHQLLQLPAPMLVGLIVVASLIAYKVFAFVFRMVLTGLAFGTFPLIANAVGIAVPLSLEAILWSALLGIVMYLMYASLMFGVRILNLMFLPFRKLFGAGNKKPTPKKDPNE